jgi:phosphoribosylformylglycinamidine synthase subunit PurL
MTDPAITPELVQKHNLTPDEFTRIKEVLGREPNYTELGIFSVMWSEHCSYKNTRPLLKTFPTKSRKILVGAGEENAGIIDIGDGLAIAFKIESHNHPSAVEPFQGAATGVGGIIRDIFTMGARPLAAMNSLRFGPITAEGPPHPGPLPHLGGEGVAGVSEGRAGSGNLPAKGQPLPGGEGRGEGGRLLAEDTDSQIANRKSQIENNKRLFAGVVSGIAHYGNCFGIPTVAGEVYFDESYEGNPLVNAFCLGVLRHDQIARGKAAGVGNPVFYVGPPTGRDGLAGASFASQDLTDESSEQQRGAVQVGDPFMEKLVLEACLELLATGAVAGIQDMGAAGLTCSTCETAARAGTGIEIELSRVPQRAPNMTPYEIMLSESQERMLIIIHQGREKEVKHIFDKWDLPWAEIGSVTDTGRMVVKNHAQIVADIPAAVLANQAPVYFRDSREPAYLQAVRSFTLATIPDSTDPVAQLKTLLARPTIASKNWVYRQYDHMVRDGSAVCPGSDAAVIRIKSDSLPDVEQASSLLGSPGFQPGNAISPEAAGKMPALHDRFEACPTKFLALTVDCNAAYVYLDPFEGAKIAVAEAARNLACSGAFPLGTTDNLNFGNPHNPEIFWQLKESVRGLAEACRALNAPVTGGNVSLYNQSPNGPIDPTPTVGMVGLIEKPEHITTQWFKDEGDVILLLGEIADAADPLLGLGGSVYLKTVHGLKTGVPPRCDLAKEKALHDALRGWIQSGSVKSAHDCSEGGLAVALAECCISQLIARDTPRLIGATIDLTEAVGAISAAPRLGEETRTSPLRLDGLLFGETQSRVVISSPPHHAAKVLAQAKILEIPATKLGVVGGAKLQIKAAGSELSWELPELHDLWWNSIGRAMK